MSSLTVSSLSKDFGPTRVVSDLNLDVPEGEMLVLVGPSGCGKTTTLRCIAGLERPSAGTIAIGDRVVPRSSEGMFVPPEKRRDRHGVPVVRGLAAHDRVRERGVSAASRRVSRVGHPRTASRRRWSSSGSRRSPSAIPRSSPAGSSSASRWRARLVPEPRAAAVRRAALESRRQPARSDAASRSRSCRSGSASRPSMSRTTRPKRWRSPTASP